MKRDSWIPSKYQFLCSDHFTPDSLDVRWGIRYLKQTAVPTIFSLPEDNQGKDSSKKKSQKKKLEDEKEVCLKAKSEESFASNQPKKNTVNTGVVPEHAKLLMKPSVPKTESIQNNLLTLNLVKQDTEKPQCTLEASVNQDIGIGGFPTSFENLNATTITLTTSNSEGIEQSLETQEVLEITTNHPANPSFPNNSVEIKSAQENPFLFSTITQTVEELNTNKESVIAIFVPTENSKPTINSFIPAQKETVDMEDIDVDDPLYEDVDYETEVLQIEHSYCRQDINKEHLWQKVSKLHSKITLLELQEQQTLGRLKSLETLIRQLKQENWLSEENVKIIENHFTTYEVTMI
ncbi:THAP domain-containing protein 5 isoform X2 [Equus przewalskii]|nr:PREDICTED: THAP domain-containing protein 5 isoform X2 [Equus przewalskii]XP_008534428.1 PREDICTED: THAP domain-containing protein 5 isoform X2 [Equus przewalskii]XP_023495299.1 THAP domain-containing protein 5 isoform X3 [Equus caballus]XP_023495300.1 THAP domain-containing protein 5 isoform X3 [Equus caballus]